jgi:hypothetical protein
MDTDSAASMDNEEFNSIDSEGLYVKARKTLAPRMSSILKFDTFISCKDDLVECEQIMNTKLFELCKKQTQGDISPSCFNEFLKYTSNALYYAMIDFNRNHQIIRGERNSKIQFDELIESSLVTSYSSLEDSAELRQYDYEKAIDMFRGNIPQELYQEDFDLLYENVVNEKSQAEIGKDMGKPTSTVNRNHRIARKNIRSLFEEISLDNPFK